MKRLFMIGLSLALLLSFAACGSQSAAPGSEPSLNETEEAAKTEVAETAKQIDFDGSSYSEMGEGTFALDTPSGSSEDGSTPYLFIGSDDIMAYVGYTGFDVDGSHLTYIYVDGIEQEREQISDFKSSIIITEDLLKEGIHKVEFVQYDTDDPSGNVIMYKTASYEVKSK